MVERFIGYIVSFAVIAGMGFGLPRWFEWRRSLVNRWPGERRDASGVFARFVKRAAPLSRPEMNGP